MKRRILICLSALVCAAGLLIFPGSDRQSEGQAVYTSGDYIKWIDFGISYNALSDALKYDTQSRGTDSFIPFTVLLSVLATKNGGDFSSYSEKKLNNIISAIKSGKTPDEVSGNIKLYNYYLRAYGAVLSSFVGEYTEIKTDADGNTTESETKYGLRVFSPFAEGYYYSDYDDFGAARSFGYKRSHLGHDMMGSVGTPIIAVESGIVEACGWNTYGGWRIGIRSFDGLRYYYYAHLRRGHPYNDIYEGKIVNAGEVIGYLGCTGYSSKEDRNNIDTPHLHFGIQIIFDGSQKDGTNQIWIDVYSLTRFLSKNKAIALPADANNDRSSSRYYVYPETPEY